MPEEKYYPMAPQQWKQAFLQLKDLHVIKFPRVLQCLFFLLRYSREDICERETARLEFKKAAALINEDLFKTMTLYDPQGPRDGEYKTYQRLKWINTNLHAYSTE